jgi:hypothetical protein
MKAIASGFQMHIPKPVEPAELVTVVASLAKRTQRFDLGIGTTIPLLSQLKRSDRKRNFTVQLR